MDLKNKLGPIIAVAMGVTATIWLFSGEQGIVQAKTPDSSEQTNANQVDTQDNTTSLFKVQATKLQSQEISQTISLSGSTIADHTLQITNQLAGRITDVYVQKGDYVSANQPLVKIDDRALLANIQQAKALVKQKTLELEGVKRLTNQKLTSEVSVASAEAALASAQATLTTLQIDLENSVVKAPFSGVLNAFSAKPNQWLSLGESIATLVDVTPLKVAVQLPQKYLQHVRLNSSVDVSIQGMPVQLGTVNYISRVADQETRSIPLEIELPSTAKKIPTEISVDLLLHLNSTKAFSISPALLSINDSGQMSLKTLNNNIVKQQAVTVVRSDSNQVWVTGLDENTLIITSGQGFVKVGDKVDVEITTGEQP